MSADGARKHITGQQDAYRTSLKLDSSGLYGSQATAKDNLDLLPKILPSSKEHPLEIASEQSNKFLHAIKQDSSVSSSDLERMFRDGSSAQFAKMLYERDIAGDSNSHEVSCLIERFAKIGNFNDTLKLELILEYYVRASKKTALNTNQIIQVNPVWSGKKFPDVDTNKYLSPWRNIHGSIALYRAKFGKNTIKILPINQNLNLSDDNKIVIIENIVFYLSCGIRSILVPMSSFNEHNNRWLFLGSNDEGIVVDGTGLVYNGVSHIDSEHNSDNLNEFIKDRVPYLEEVGKCICFDPTKYDHKSIRDVFEVSMAIRGFLSRMACVQEIEHHMNYQGHKKPISSQNNHQNQLIYMNYKEVEGNNFNKNTTKNTQKTRQTNDKYDFGIFGLLDQNYDQNYDKDLLTQQKNLTIEEIEHLIQSNDFQHVMKIRRDIGVINTQIPREKMWFQIDSHEFPDLNYNELLELIEQAGKNRDLWLDVSHWYEKSTGRVFFNGNPYSIKELHFNAKDDFDFMAVLAFYWYREVPWRREKAIDILNRLEELGNIYASHYLGTICIFYDSYSQAKTANHYIKAVSKLKNCPPRGHHIESIIYGNLGIALWWWQDLFPKNEKNRLFNAYRLLCKGAALGNIYILGRLAEFLCKAIDTKKSRLISRIIIDKLIQWKTFLADYYSASIEYMHNFESIRCGDEKYKEIVEKLERSIRDEKWDSFPISKQKTKLSLAFIFLRHDQSKRNHALNMLYETNKNKAEEFSKCDTRQKELDYIKDFFYIENKYLNLNELKEKLTELTKEIKRLRMELVQEKKNNDELKNQVAYFRCRADNSMSQGNSPESHHVDNSTNKNHDNYASMEDSISLQQKSTVDLELPTKVPSKWIWKNWKQHNSGASPEILLKESEFWKPYYDAGVLYQDVLRHLDATLYKALDNFCYNKSKAKPEKEKIRLRDILKPKRNRIDLEVERYRKDKERKKALRQATKERCLKIAMEGHQEDLKEENRLRKSVHRRENIS